MDLLTRTDLEALAERDRSGTHVSLFIPTHRFGAGARADSIRWKKLVAGVEDALGERGLRTREINELLAPAWALHEDALAWQYMSDGLAVFLRPGWQRTFRVPVDVPEVATVGGRFVVGPLLRVLAGGEHFLLLALSQHKVRLLEGSRHRIEEVELGDVPTSLRAVIEPPEQRSDTMARPAARAGRGGPAVFYGHGGADEHFRRAELVRFLRRVAGGLRDYLADQNLPMVLAGLDHMLGMYRSLGPYPHLLPDAVRRNPDQLTADELHVVAWPIVAEHLLRVKRRAIERFEELHGTGLASNNPEEIDAAALHGRIDTLFLAANPWCWEQVHTGRPPAVVQLGADDAFSHCELLDEAAVNTLSRHGQLYAIADLVVPGGGDVAAVFRY